MRNQSLKYACATNNLFPNVAGPQPAWLALCFLTAFSLLLPGCGSKTSEQPTVSVADIQKIESKAEAGDAAAQVQLGAAYAKGESVKQDYQRAAQWYERAAKQGNAQAQAALGELFEAGQGVPHDDVQAATWYRRAAEQNLSNAQYNLAALYAVGKGVPLNNAEALKWYLKAANQGDPLAQYNVGMRYYEGHGVGRDQVAAYKWLALASAQQIPDATRALKTLKDNMSREQVGQARELVKQFKTSATGTP